MTGTPYTQKLVSTFDEIWEYVGANNMDAADRVIAEILLPFAA